MSLLEEVARNLGLMIHNIGAEVRGAQSAQVHEHSRRVEEERPAPGIVIRRTTVEEIILAPGVDPATLKNPDSRS